MVVVNSGNPTGNVLTRSDMEDIIKVAYENKFLIVADEVHNWQHNDYNQNLEAPFLSFRKVLAELGAPYSNKVELMTLNSVSKGTLGDFLGGYYECHNFTPFANEIVSKLK